MDRIERGRKAEILASKCVGHALKHRYRVEATDKFDKADFKIFKNVMRRRPRRRSRRKSQWRLSCQMEVKERNCYSGDYKYLWINKSKYKHAKSIGVPLILLVYFNRDGSLWGSIIPPNSKTRFHYNRHYHSIMAKLYMKDMVNVSHKTKLHNLFSTAGLCR